jgi:hypothetical protein
VAADQLLVIYALDALPEYTAYLHAQWRRSDPLDYQQVRAILDGAEGQGQYVGTYLAWPTNNNGWWGEIDINFHLDGDRDFPTICGTGTEDFSAVHGCSRIPTADTEASPARSWVFNS